MNKLMMKRTNPIKQKYRIIGFKTKSKLKNHFSEVYNIPRSYSIIMKEGEHFKMKFYDVNFVCLTDVQKEQLTKICEKCK